MRSALLWGGASGKPEIANACPPVEATRCLVVLVRVVEGAVVNRINGEIAVIAPAIGSACLATGAVEKMLFTRQGVQWIGCQAACIADLWVNGAAGRAKAQGDIALVIGTDAAHPAPGGIRLISALLKDSPVPRLRPSQLNPADPCHRVGAYRIVIEE